MIRPLLMALCVLVILGTVPAGAASISAVDQRHWYVSGAFGQTITDMGDWKEGSTDGELKRTRPINFAGALGLNFIPQLGADLEFSYRQADLKHLTIRSTGSSAPIAGPHKVWAVLLNGYLNLAPHWDFSPYLSLGIGLAHHAIEIPGVPALGISGASGSSNVIAYELGVGANYNIGDKTQLFGGYRYLGSERPEIGNTEYEYGAHELRLGLRKFF